MTEISADVAYLLAIHRDRSNCNELKVELSYEKLVVNGQHRFPIELTKQRPTIEIQRDEQQSDSCLTLVMIDPDAPSSDNPKTGPFVHWIVSNVQRSDQQELCPYRSPAPGRETGIHRYIYLVYDGRCPVLVDDTRFDRIEERRRFPLKEFVDRNQLRLVWSNFIQIHSD